MPVNTLDLVLESETSFHKSTEKIRDAHVDPCHKSHHERPVSDVKTKPNMAALSFICASLLHGSSCHFVHCIFIQ